MGSGTADGLGRVGIKNVSFREVFWYDKEDGNSACGAEFKKTKEDGICLMGKAVL